MIDAADDFVAGNDRIFDGGEFAIDDVKVGSADPARADLNADLAVARLRIRPFLQLKRRPRAGQYHRAHPWFSWRNGWSKQVIFQPGGMILTLVKARSPSQSL
jgi:hypothetical protein